jgi:iron complex outermembrane receptor protein
LENALSGLVGRRPLRAVLALALTIVSGVARGEEPILGEVTVHARREPEKTVAQERTAFATVVETSEKTSEVESVSDVLAETVGVQVRRFGGLGAFSTLSIRGSAANQVQIYLDGVPVSRARNEVVNLATLPLDGVDHIEVYRNSAPIAFGRSGPGGVVNIVTKSPGDKPRTMISASYGSFETRKVDVERSARHGPWEYLLFGNYMGTAGDFTFLDDNGTPTEINPFDDVEATRQNNGFDAVDLIVKGGYRVSERTALRLTNETFYKDGGVSGPGSIQSRDASLEQLRTLTHFRSELRGLGTDALDLRVTAHALYDRSQFRDRAGEIGIGREDNDNRTIAVGGDALFTYYWGDHQVPGLLVEVGHEGFVPRSLLDPENAGPDQQRLRTTVAAQDEVYLWGERLLVVPAVRWEWVRDESSGAPAEDGLLEEPRERADSFTSPRLGARLEVAPGLDLLGNIGRAFRPPNLGELFGDRGLVKANPDLRPEEATNRDVGLRFRRSNLGVVEDVRFEYAYFDNEIDDLILLIPFSRAVFKPINVSAARIRGHEAALSARAWGHVSIAANYTQQDAIDVGVEPWTHGKRLLGLPEHEFYVRGELYNDWGRLFYDVNLIGDNFGDRRNLRRIPSRDFHGLGLSLTPPRTGLTVTFEVKNLTDEQTVDFYGFPLPGRAFFGTVRYAF